MIPRAHTTKLYLHAVFWAVAATSCDKASTTTIEKAGSQSKVGKGTTGSAELSRAPQKQNGSADYREDVFGTLDTYLKDPKSRLKTAKIMLELMERNGVAVIGQALLEQVTGEQRETLLFSIFSSAGFSNPKLAVELLAFLPEGKSKYAHYAAALTSVKDGAGLTVLLAGLDSNSGIRSQIPSLSMAIQQKLNDLDIHDLKVMRSTVSPDLQGALQAEIFRKLGDKMNLSEFESELNMLRPEGRGHAVEAFMTGLARSDPRAALKYILEKSDSHQFSDIALNQVAGNLFRVDPVSGLKDILRIEQEGNLRAGMLGMYVSLWFEQGSQELSVELEKLPAGPATDAALKSFISKLNPATEAGEIAAWIKRISDQELRRQLEARFSKL